MYLYVSEPAAATVRSHMQPAKISLKFLHVSSSTMAPGSSAGIFTGHLFRVVDPWIFFFRFACAVDSAGGFGAVATAEGTLILRELLRIGMDRRSN